MKTWQNIKKWLCDGCVYFTVISLFFFLLSLIGTDPDNLGRINVSSYLWMLPCGLCLSAAGMLLRVQGIARWGRYLIHYIITVLSLYLFIFLPSSDTPSGSSLMVIFVLLTLLYWIFFGLIMLIISRVRRLMEED